MSLRLVEYSCAVVDCHLGGKRQHVAAVERWLQCTHLVKQTTKRPHVSLLAIRQVLNYLRTTHIISHKHHYQCSAVDQTCTTPYSHSSTLQLTTCIKAVINDTVAMTSCSRWTVLYPAWQYTIQPNVVKTPLK